MGKFTVEEINLMCVFGTENRSKLIADMKNVLPHLEDSSMKNHTDVLIFHTQICAGASQI